MGKGLRSALGCAVLVGCVAAVSVSVATERNSVASRLKPEQIARLNAVLEETRRNYCVPGLAVGAVDREGVLYVGTFGVEDEDSGAEVTVETMFHLASISKTFTALSILQLAEAGVLSVDDPLERSIPAFESSGITLRHLLTHSGGLRDWEGQVERADHAGVDSYIESVANHQRAYSPGTGWEYSDAAFNVLGRVVEQVSGLSYSRYLQENVLSKGGMFHINVDRPSEGRGTASPHRGQWYVRKVSGVPWDVAFAPSSGVQATIGEVLKWASIHLRRDPALLNSASYEMLFSFQRDTSWDETGMGLGWQLEQRGNQWFPRHAGGDQGSRSLLTLFPEKGLAIVILSNGETTPRWEIRNFVEAVIEGDISAAVPEDSLPGWWVIFAVGLCLILLGIGYRYRSKLWRSVPTSVSESTSKETDSSPERSRLR